MSDFVVATPYGRLSGESLDGVNRFLGVPYAAPPTQALRLRSPRPPSAWSGIRSATQIAPAAPQRLAGMQTWLNDPVRAFDEDCLYLNIWTPAHVTSAPILVWFHGGATRAGHGGAAAINGEHLARLHGIMVVTVNYRLGPLGGLAHPDLSDETTGASTNWGLQDKIAALRWLQQCAAAFGGDAANVTLAGQSSGGTNVLLIAQNPDCRGLFARVIAQSPPLFQSPMFAELDDAAEYTQAIAEKLNVSVRGLRDMDGRELVRRELEFLQDSDFARRFGRPRTAPIRDGVLVRHWPYTGSLPAVPLLIGTTRDESRFWYDLKLPDGTRLTSMQAPADEAELTTEVSRLVRLYYPFANAPTAQDVLTAYRGHGSPNSRDLWFEIYTDLVFRAPVAHYAARHAQAGHSAYLYEFCWPLAAPVEAAPHAADVPFVFGTTAHPHVAAKIGHASESTALSTQMMDMWARFIKRGAPSDDAWRPFSGNAPHVMSFGQQRRLGECRPMDRREQMAVWPAFDATETQRMPAEEV